MGAMMLLSYSLLFNGSANFFQAISLPHTPGLTQTILNLLGVPLVALLVPLALFLLMVITSVLYQWVAFICSAIGSCICARPNEAASAAAVLSGPGSAAVVR